MAPITAPQSILLKLPQFEINCIIISNPPLINALVIIGTNKTSPDGSILFSGLFPTYRYKFKSPLLYPRESVEINLPVSGS